MDNKVAFTALLEEFVRKYIQEDGDELEDCMEFVEVDFENGLVKLADWEFVLTFREFFYMLEYSVDKEEFLDWYDGEEDVADYFVIEDYEEDEDLLDEDELDCVLDELDELEDEELEDKYKKTKLVLSFKYVI